jgi:chaperonin GroES
MFRQADTLRGSLAVLKKQLYQPRRKCMKIRPLHDRVIVKRLEEERKTASGIVIPDNATEKPDQGEIIAVGPGKRDENGKPVPLDVKPKDRVLFGKYAGQTVKVDGEELLVMREEDIMGVVEA